MDDLSGEYDEHSYFEDYLYREYQRKDILNEENGKIDFLGIGEDLKLFQDNLPSFKRKEIISLEEMFYHLKSYEEKLQFWIDNKLGLINIDFSFTKKFENKKYRIPFSIEPINDVENNLYFEYL